MAYSGERKQALVGWSFNHAGFFSNMQLQNFCFSMNCFQKIDGDRCFSVPGL